MATLSRVLVLGGGVAGIAAALSLRDLGFEVELWEAHRQLGGRVSSFADRRLSIQLDNGPHVVLGCYDHFRALLRRLGTEQAFEAPRALTLTYREPQRSSELTLSRMPIPIALPLALLGARGWTWGERLRALRGAVATRRGAPSHESFEAWLQRRRQHGRPRQFLWEPLCLAVMNAPPALVSAQLMLATLTIAFSGRAARGAMWVPRRAWSEIVGEPALAALERAGVRVRLGRRAEAFDLRDRRLAGVRSDDGATFSAADDGAVVSALPWHALQRLLPSMAQGLAGRAIVNVTFSCGIDVKLPFDRWITALVGGQPFQFVYRQPGDSGGRMTLIGAGCRALEGSVATIVAAARNQLSQWFPGFTVPAQALARVTKEPNATLDVPPGIEARRPTPGWHPDLRNLALCGDWTQTGLPSTLEGAAKSAAQLVQTLTRA